MKVFIFQYVGKVSGNYHPEGGLVIIAKDINRVKEMIAEQDVIELTEDDYNDVIELPLENKNTTEEIYTFPDAGCC